MAGKPKTVADLMEEVETLEARQPGADEAIDLEMDKYKRMMDDCAGVTDGEIVFWLHRASEKNKGLHTMYLKRYPKETPLADIFDEARDQYGAGDYVVLAKKDEVIFRKLPFSTGKPLVPEKIVEKPPEDPFVRLSQGLEKALLVDKVSKALDTTKEKPLEVKTADPAIALLTTVLTGVMAQNTALLQGMMTQRREAPQPEGGSVIEGVKLGMTLAGIKVPGEEGEGGVIDIIKSLAPYVPQIIAGFRGAPPAQPRPPVRVHPVPPPHAVPAELSLPVPPADPAEAARTLVMGRIMDELKYVITLPPHPKLFDHVIDYIDTYMPSMVRQAEVVDGETFAGYMITLDPAFAEKKQFFLDLHAHLMLEEIEPGEEITKVAEPF